jgi:hypothetical protein
MFTEPILIEEGLDRDHAYLISHLGILKVFALWGLLESILYYMTKGNKTKEVLCHLFILVAISLFAYAYPDMKENLT